MATDFSITYVDRTDGRLCTEKVYADRFLSWCYNNRAGWAVTAKLLARPPVSRFYGWTQRRRWSRRRIKPFVERFGINCAELTRPLESFDSFSEFFTREIDLTSRVIDQDPNACIAPVDGKVIVVKTASARTSLQIKRHKFNLCSLLRDPALACQYDGGS